MTWVGFECWFELVGMTAPILIRQERTSLVYFDPIWVSSILKPSALLPSTTYVFLQQTKKQNKNSSFICTNLRELDLEALLPSSPFPSSTQTQSNNQDISLSILSDHQIYLFTPIIHIIMLPLFICVISSLFNQHLMSSFVKTNHLLRAPHYCFLPSSPHPHFT